MAPRRRAPPKPEGQDHRAERVAAFAKTKMCKFFILGDCAKGSGCQYAHAKEELECMPDLTCTKLCKKLLQEGCCDDPECKYAHSREELRPTTVPDVGPRTKTRGHAQPSSQEFRQQQMQQSSSSEPFLGGSAAWEQPGLPSSVGFGLQDPLAMQDYATMLDQVGQAAQAHAMEAARLHAMAVQLQSNVGGGRQSYPSGLPAFARRGGAPDQRSSSVVDRQSRIAGVGPNQIVQAVPNTGRDTDDLSPGPDAQPMIIRTDTLSSLKTMTSSASLQHLVLSENEETLFDELDKQPKEQAVDSLGVESPQGLKKTRFGGVGESAAAAVGRGIGSGDFDRNLLTVKNTFLDFEPRTSALSSLRHVHTAEGRLADLG